MAEKRTYRVQGFTCAGCAAQFERNVKKLPSVHDAKVNFATSKITVYGNPSIAELEKAGSFENLRVSPENEEMTRIPLWKNKGAIRTLISGILLVLGWIFYLVYGEGNPYSLFAFASSIVIGGYTLFVQGIKNLFHLRFDMKTLMTVAILGAAAIGEWGEGATVVFLFAISEALETYSMDKARQSIRSLMEIAPKEAIIRRNGGEMQVSVEEIQIGDIMIVKPGQKIAMDGRVVKGHSAVNQAAITGESLPVEKSSGDEVFAGTLNEEGLLEVEVTKRSEDTTIAKIIHLVEEAQSERAPSQAFIDRFAKYYTPVVMLIAVGIATIPPQFIGGVWQDWIYRGLALLVVACPCALVISTPVSIVTAIGNAARHGVLIKGGVYLEKAGALSAIAFDKTGTLTKGVPQVTDIISYDGTGFKTEALNQENPAWFGMAAAIEKGSQHPLGAAIVRHAEQAGCDLSPYEVEDFQSLTGKGVQATLYGQAYYIGSPGLLQEKLATGLSEDILKQIRTLQEEGKTAILVGNKERVLGLIAVRDEIRESSRSIIDQLHQLGIKRTVMLTGDNRVTATAISKQVGIPDVKAELLPQDKLEVIKHLKRHDHKVAMVGDGVNDAPALAAADIGMAMGGAGTDTAMETADIVFMADDISRLPFTIRLSRKALQIIKQNVAFSLGIKLAAILLIIPGWLTLWLAILADVGATLLVTLNGMRLIRMKEDIS
ncbi:Cd2+/Zn2+-exporting ATPase [Caldalkalibacillus uzonensis]|uniref:Cd(2+)-exporting ATPase n=1 Tax=Caldalkalibacillus uzonensis TaxID=353224 RepID=A0ABU0CR66_9BACI|nr:heavy metal translocating P-type ATPase [Caldalkalibacillus uzonensis]MDQ0338918.1 Cd2+/Zn2+-exporting ATPase [Caldalkalibacillus uzonensis]